MEEDESRQGGEPEFGQAENSGEIADGYSEIEIHESQDEEEEVRVSEDDISPNRPAALSEA